MNAGSGIVDASATSASVLRLVGLYRVLSRCYFHLPILFVFLYDRLSLSAVELVLAGYGLLIVLAPWVTARPTSRLSLRKILITGEVVKVGGLTLLGLGTPLGSILTGQALCALGFSLTAGTDSAYLGTLCSGAEYRRREALTQSWMFAGSLASGVIGAVLFMQSQSLPFVASALAAGLAAVTLMLPGVRTSDGPAAENPPAESYPGSVSASRVSALVPSATSVPLAHGQDGVNGPTLGAPLDGAPLLWSRYYSLARGFVLAAYVGFVPYLLYVQLHLSLGWFGVVLGAFTLTGFVVARACGRARRDRARELLALTSVLATVGAFALLSKPGGLSAVLAAIVLLGIGSGTVRPLVMGSLEPSLRAMAPGQRRQITTSMERRQALFSATILTIGGFGVSRYGISTLFLILSLAYLGATGLLAITSRIGPKAEPDS